MRNYDDDIKRIWRNRYKILLRISIFLIIGVIFFIITTRLDNKNLDRFKKRYRYIESSDSFSGVVQAINCFKGASVVSLTNSDEFVIAASRNYEYQTFEMCCFISIGDSILKLPYNDTIMINRDKSLYYFIQGENIGKKYDSRFYNNPCR
jgi:hypothetical protein